MHKAAIGSHNKSIVCALIQLIGPRFEQRGTSEQWRRAVCAVSCVHFHFQFSYTAPATLLFVAAINHHLCVIKTSPRM